MILPALFAWSANFEAVQEKGHLALKQGNVKEAEALYQEFLKTGPEEEKGIAEVQLAIAFYKDQEHEKAFQIFLDALNQSKIKQFNKMSDEELEIYNRALKIYLEDSGLTPKETSQKIDLQFSALYKKNPCLHHLGYLLAMGEANLGHYDRFFDIFYQSYLNDPDNFLAYKAKAVLHIKLFERSKTDDQRELERKYILDNATQAIALQANDTSLYRMILGFASEETKATVLSTYLNKIIDENILLSRVDIPYYVEMAIAFEQYDLAQRFLDKARLWYKSSRFIQAAQQHLDAKKGSYGN